jgi:hypothetical protein
VALARNAGIGKRLGCDCQILLPCLRLGFPRVALYIALCFCSFTTETRRRMKGSQLRYIQLSSNISCSIFFPSPAHSIREQVLCRRGSPAAAAWLVERAGASCRTSTVFPFFCCYFV